MNRCLATCCHLSALVAIGCSAADTARPTEAAGVARALASDPCLTIADVITGEVVEARPTDKAWLRLRWAVPLLHRDVVDAWEVIATAGTRCDPGPVWLVDGRRGVLHTRRGDYDFDVGEIKTASRTHRVSLYPTGSPDGREELHWILPKEAGQRLIRLLDRRLAGNAHLAKRQGHVVKKR